jgi:DNA-directed RNA polymerase subunit RPC12/RpoP
MAKYNINIVREIFCKEKYTLLSDAYVNAQTKLDVICPEGHKWKVCLADFNRGYRCKYCAGNVRLTIEYVREYFENEGYTLVSNAYRNTSYKLDVVCPKGHRWSVSFGNFKNGGVRCPYCSNRVKKTLKEVKSIFAAEGYEVLDTEYINNSTDLTVVCPSKKHIWKVPFTRFYYAGCRCPYCSGMAKNKNIEDVSDYFAAAGYTLLSDTWDGNKVKLKAVCPEGHIVNITWNDFQQGIRCVECSGNGKSREEEELFCVVEGLGVDVVRNTRSIISPKELDIYIPSKKLAIEYCGLYWHSEVAGAKNRKYHRNKLDLCKEKGIRLITIFGDEYNNRPDVVISRIKNALGFSDVRVFARKCKVELINKQVGNTFLEKYHLQGSISSKYYVGLFYNDELVSVISFGAPARAHVRKPGRIELKRMCSKPGVSIVGGFSKMLSFSKRFLIDNGVEEIISYCDMRWADLVPVYEKLGFTLLRESKATCHYLLDNYTRRVRNQSLSLREGEKLLGKTEWELRLKQGYDRIFDCGHRTYVYGLK